MTSAATKKRSTGGPQPNRLCHCSGCENIQQMAAEADIATYYCGVLKIVIDPYAVRICEHYREV